MKEVSAETRSVIVEREFAHPPEHVWHALTQSDLLDRWLLPNDFLPVVGRRFTLRAEWGSVSGEVLAVEPPSRLSYTWGDDDLDSVVTWLLTPTPAGTRLRLEQTGFRADQPRYFQGARAGWPKFLDGLESLLAGRFFPSEGP